MVIINQTTKINLEWQVQRVCSKEPENFEHSVVRLFLKSDSNKWHIPCTANRKGVVTATIPGNMPLQTFGFELLWVKNDKHVGRTRCAMRTEKMQVYTLSDIENADLGEATIHLKTSAVSYGYDGFSTYELAVFKDYTTLSEDEWTKVQASVMDDYETPLLDVTKEYTPVHSGRRTYICTDETGAIEGGVVALHKSIAQLVHPSDVTAGDTIGCHLGDMLVVCRVDDSYIGKIFTDDEAQESEEGIKASGLVGRNQVLYAYKGTKSSFSALQADVTSGKAGDVYNVEDTGMNYAIVSVKEGVKIATFTLLDGNTVELAEGDKITLTIGTGDTATERVCSCFFMPVEPGSDDKEGVLYYTDEENVAHLVQLGNTSYDEITLSDYIKMYSFDELEQEGFVNGDYIVSDSIETKNVVTWDALGALAELNRKVDMPSEEVESGKVLTSMGDGKTEWLTPKAGMTDEEKADLEKLMNKEFPISASVSLSPTVIEKGKDTVVTLSWSGVQVDGAAVESTATVNGVESASPFKESLSGSKTYTLVISQVGGTRAITYRPSVTAVYPTWFGFAVADSAITADNIGSLVSALASSKSLKTSATFNATSTNDAATKKFCIVMPYTASKIISNNFNILSDFTRYTVSYGGTTYYCYVGNYKIKPGSYTYAIS